MGHNEEETQHKRSTKPKKTEKGGSRVTNALGMEGNCWTGGQESRLE